MSEYKYINEQTVMTYLVGQCIDDVNPDIAIENLLADIKLEILQVVVESISDAEKRGIKE